MFALKRPKPQKRNCRVLMSNLLSACPSVCPSVSSVIYLHDRLQMALLFSIISYLVITHNGHYWSGIFSGKTEKMAAGCDDFRLFLGDFRHFFAGVLSINIFTGKMINVFIDPNIRKCS